MAQTRPLDDDQLIRYVNTLNSCSEEYLPYAAISALILGSSARIGEALSTKVRYVFDLKGQPRERVTRVLQKKRDRKDEEKELSPTKDKTLTTPFPWQYLGEPIIRWYEFGKHKYLLAYDCYLFSKKICNTPLNQRTCRRWNKLLLEEAGIKPDGVAYHGLRKTIAIKYYKQRLKENNNNVLDALTATSKLLGHSDINTTIIYLEEYLFISQKDVINNAYEWLLS